MLILHPVQDDFAGLARSHNFKGFLILGIVKSMGDDRGDIQPRLNHHRHFIPGFIHFAAIDPLNAQTVENNQIPIDGGGRGEDTQKRNFSKPL